MLPAYYLPQPAANWDEATIASFERLYTETIDHAMSRAVSREPAGGVPLIDYTLTAPKWQFLCYLCDHKNIVLHGSGEPDIVEFEPRQSNDVGEFGNRRAVYAASDGIWPMYFAIVDRKRYSMSLVNACFRVIDDMGATDAVVPGATGHHYYFSISDDALIHKPWRSGTIYILPRASFEQQPAEPFRGRTIEIVQWASPVAVKPLAKIAVTPEDFPFLDQIRPHNREVLHRRVQANRDNFPWETDDDPAEQTGP